MTRNRVIAVRTPSGTHAAERLWKLTKGVDRRTATLVRVGKTLELRFALNGTVVRSEPHADRTGALEQARLEREALEGQGWTTRD